MSSRAVQTQKKKKKKKIWFKKKREEKNPKKKTQKFFFFFFFFFFFRFVLIFNAFSIASIQHIVWAILQVPHILATDCGKVSMLLPLIACVKNLLLSVNLIWTSLTFPSLTF